MANFVQRALDATGWRAHKIQTDLTYAVEKGRAFTGSDRFAVLAGATEYIEFRIPADVKVRVYERIVATAGDTFNVDLVRADSITAGDTELTHACLNCVIGDLPRARFWRGVTGVTGEENLEFSTVPADRGPQAVGGTQVSEAFRVLNGTGDGIPLLRVTNTGGTDRDFTITVVWTEEV